MKNFKKLRDEALRQHKKISSMKTFRGFNRDGIIAASVYIACRIHNYPRTAKEIATKLNITGSGSYVRVSNIKKQAIQKLIENVEHSQVIDFL